MNVIPSEGEATLDVRALPDENMDKLYADMQTVVGDPGPARTEDDSTNYGAHGDVERLPEASLDKFIEFTWNTVAEVAISK